LSQIKVRCDTKNRCILHCPPSLVYLHMNF
jgi:hypothetical protein